MLSQFHPHNVCVVTCTLCLVGVLRSLLCGFGGNRSNLHSTDLRGVTSSPPLGLFPSRLWILAPNHSVCTKDDGLYSEFPRGVLCTCISTMHNKEGANSRAKRGAHELSRRCQFHDSSKSRHSLLPAVTLEGSHQSFIRHRLVPSSAFFDLFFSLGGT